MHRPHPHGPYTMTGSPGANPVALGPVCSTQPAFSCPRVNGNVNDLAPAGSSSRCRSEWQAPAPPTLTSTSPGPGSGICTSPTSPGRCHSTNWKAFTSVHDALEGDLEVTRSAEHLALPIRWRVDDET